MSSVIDKKIEQFPKLAKSKFLELRSLVFEAGEELGVEFIDETLKWGEPTFLAPSGSAIRIDWKAKSPDEIGVFFNCKTRLVETFKEVYFDVFKFQTNRAIVLKLDQPTPPELKACFAMALNYHKIKNRPLLGA